MARDRKSASPTSQAAASWAADSSSARQRSSWTPEQTRTIQELAAARGAYTGPVDGARTPELDEALTKLLGRRSGSLSPRRVITRLRELGGETLERSSSNAAPAPRRRDLMD